jgi:excisionase family DNA binding protein
VTICRLRRRRHPPAVRVGKNYRIRESDVNRYLAERSVRTEANS